MPIVRSTSFSFFFVQLPGDHRYLHSFPTRRSSDLAPKPELYDLIADPNAGRNLAAPRARIVDGMQRELDEVAAGDRKSTRLNSSHANISYAVFCLKKKKNKVHDRTICEKNDTSQRR